MQTTDHMRTPIGKEIVALVARPPSPEKPPLALPANVVMVPLLDTTRTRLFPYSQAQVSYGRLDAYAGTSDIIAPPEG